VQLTLAEAAIMAARSSNQITRMIRMGKIAIVGRGAKRSPLIYPAEIIRCDTPVTGEAI
jgi:hypothetical protein